MKNKPQANDEGLSSGAGQYAASRKNSSPDNLFWSGSYSWPSTLLSIEVMVVPMVL